MRVCPTCKLEYRDDGIDVCAIDGATLVPLEDTRIGKLVGGRYVLDEVIGEGGMAVVYHAHHTLIERQVAVKVLHKHLAHDSTLRERFHREAKSAATIAHENVIQIYDFGETDDGCPFLVMELLTGEPLRKFVERGPMEPALVCELGIQMARGLARAHDLGIAHRDLKPENVFVSKRESGKYHAKLVDFGIAQSKKEARLTARGSLIGTPQYLAPERIKGVELGAPSDLYSFGVLLFEMLTGRTPFVSEDLPGYLIQHMEAKPPAPSSLAPSCPKELEDLVLRLLEKEPKDRPVDMHQVARELEDVLLALDGEIARGPTERPVQKAEGKPKSLPPVTLEHLERRCLLCQQALRRGYPDGAAPVELAASVDEMTNLLTRLNALQSERRAHHKAIDLADSDAQKARERLGHAVHEIGTDLSSAREALRAAELMLAQRTREVEDLEFQLSALRENLAGTERLTDVRRKDAEDKLKVTEEELSTLETALDEQARKFVAQIHEDPRLMEVVGDVDLDA